MNPCPIIFEPIFKPKLWGGRKLEALLGKSLPPNEPIGESWEAADLEDDQSVVAAGPAKGMRLDELVRQWGEGFLGGADLFEGRFPLLLKYLDAREDLSVQVHPSPAVASARGGVTRVKNEAWYILDAEPGGCIYRGLTPGTTEAGFRAAIANGSCASLLQRIPVRPGQCYYLPSGTVHALGAGVVVAEVQTPSDVTYRVFDWNRVEPATGKPRTLHVDDALASINFGDQSIRGESRSHVASPWTTITRLVTCESFIIERVKMTEGFDQTLPYAHLVVWMVLEGRGFVTWNSAKQKLDFKRGDTVILPARLGDARLTITSDSTWLEVTVPTTRPPV